MSLLLWLGKSYFDQKSEPEVSVDLSAATKKYMTKIQADNPIQRAARKQVKSVSNPGLKVGMKIPPYAINHFNEATVTKVSDKSFWIEADTNIAKDYNNPERFMFRGHEGIVDYIIKQNEERAAA